MKKFLLLFAVVAMLLPGCKKIEESIDALGGRIEALENETIPTIDEQIAAINVSLDALDTTDKELKGYIDGLQATADNLQEQINATNTKIDEVKAALQGEISDAKAEVLAELEALETELKNELSQINATIETLIAKDAELDKKIADLRTYVDTELGKTTDWVNATFATLEQYNALVAEVTTIKAQIVAINESIADLETRLTTKINEDIATAVATLNSTIQQKVSEITTAYTNAVKTAKDELTVAYTTAIATAISSLETSLKSWVGEQLENYYTIAEVDALLVTLTQEMNDKLEAQKVYLEGLISELSEQLTKNIANNKELIDALREDVSTLQNTTASHASKIAQNAIAISTNARSIIDNAAAISKNGSNISANGKLIADNKTLIENNAKLIAENKSAIEVLKSSTDAAIANNATAITKNAEDIAKNASLISQNATAINNNAQAIANNTTEIANLKTSLETTASEITEAYKKAIKDAIDTNNGVINGKIANEVATISTRIDNEVTTINTAITTITARIATLENEVRSIKQQITNIKADISKLLARIQSVSYIPEYADGKATVKYVERISQVTLAFEVSPKDAVTELAKIWQDAVTLKAVYTQTRAVSFVDMPIVKFEADATNGIISVTASGENLSAEFFNGTQSASVRLSISDGNNSVTSDYIPMIAKYDTTIMEENTIVDGVLYISTAQDLAKLNDPNISSAKLVATLDMTGVDWTPIENFSGVFDGNISKGYEIKNLSAPLFNKMTGEVKNLKISANITNITSRGTGALVCTLGEGGAISNCEVSGKIEVTVSGTQLSGTSYIAGVAGYALETSTITNTTNNCAITICSTETVDSNMFVGGVLGYKYSNVGLTIDNCCNNGEIIFDVITSKSVYLGGVVAEPRSNTIIKGNIANNGNILFNGSCKTLYMGGVFAKLNISATFSEDCTIVNSGTLCNNTPDLWNQPSSCGTSETAYIGGIIGSNSSTSIAGYTVNIGDLLFQNLSATTQYIGGIVGNTTTYIVGAKCYCNIEVSDYNFTNVGWITGTPRSSTVYSTNCAIGGYTLEYNEETEESYIVPVFTIKNYFNYIYGGDTDWSGTDNYDECTYLTEKPTIAQL